MTIKIVEASNPPARIVAQSLVDVLNQSPVRLAFAGVPGSGKSTIAKIITEAGDHIAHIDHDDPAKAAVVDWLIQDIDILDQPVNCRWERFADFIGIDPQIARLDLAYVLEPLFRSLSALSKHAFLHQWPLTPRMSQEAKIHFASQHAHAFQLAVKHYREATEEIEADPDYWVKQTVSRGIAHRIAVNADTRWQDEADLLRACGWTVIYLYVDAGTLHRRWNGSILWSERQRRFAGPGSADVVIDNRGTPGATLLELLRYLDRRRRFL